MECCSRSGIEIIKYHLKNFNFEEFIPSLAKWDGKMVDITEIMDMLDWHMPSDIQLEGISLARNTEEIIPFIQPLTPKRLLAAANI